MKKMVVILMVICLGGCLTVQKTPPAGCENSLVWRCGFMPTGKEVVELGFAALLAGEPDLKNTVKLAALKGRRLVQEGSLRAAVGELMVFLEKHPRYAPLALFALQRLDLDQTLDRCDREVLLSLFHNIALYAGAEDQDFTTGPAAAAGP